MTMKMEIMQTMNWFLAELRHGHIPLLHYNFISLLLLLHKELHIRIQTF